MGDARNEKHAHRVVESVARESYGRLVAYLAARTRDVAGAEDALSEALVSALSSWAREGVPRHPEAWLLTVARNRIIDQTRRARVRDQSATTLELIARESEEDVAAPETIPDERLKLLFVCAHPAIDSDIHTPLMLQTVLGLSVAEIARAFLVSPEAMGQRLVRAKNKIRHAGVAFDVPEKQELPCRLEAVLNAIYAAYGSGWADAVDADPRARGLADEAIWLARVLKGQMPQHPEVRGLLALMLHCEARRPARRAHGGKFVPLDKQDPKLWITRMIAEAESELAAAAQLATQRIPGSEANKSEAVELANPRRRDPDGAHHPQLSEMKPARASEFVTSQAQANSARSAGINELAPEAMLFANAGRYQLEAAIQSVHADRARTGRTDWDAIAMFYAHLIRLSPTLGARVAHAAAVAEVQGAEAGLHLLDAIAKEGINAYQPYWAVRAHLLQLLKRRQEALEAFDQAAGLEEDAAVRQYLLERKALM